MNKDYSFSKESLYFLKNGILTIEPSAEQSGMYRTIATNEGDAISFPRGERIAHQFYNHTNETVDILMMGENLPYDACYYPDSDKWLSRSIPGVGKFEVTDYWTDEPDIPVMKQSLSSE